MVEDGTSSWDPIEENSFFRPFNVNKQLNVSLSDLVKELKLEGDEIEDILQDLDWFSLNRSRLGILTGWIEYELDNGYNWELFIDSRNLVSHSDDEKVAFVNRILGGTQRTLMNILSSMGDFMFENTQKRKVVSPLERQFS